MNLGLAPPNLDVDGNCLEIMQREFRKLSHLTRHLTYKTKMPQKIFSEACYVIPLGLFVHTSMRTCPHEPLVSKRQLFVLIPAKF